MSKRASKRNFIFLAILVVIGVVLSVCSFPIPFIDTDFNGFANSIKLGLDLKGGISAVYEAKLPTDSNSTDLGKSIDATINRLSSLLYGKGFTESSVTRQGSDRIRIEVPDVSDPAEIFKLIGEPTELFIRKTELPKDDAGAILPDPDGNVMSAKHVKNVYASQQQTSGSSTYEFGVVLEFTTDGEKLFSDLTTEIAGNTGNNFLYIYLGDELFSKLTVSSGITGGSTFISGGSISDAESAENFALQIMSGTFDVNLKLLENNIVSATLGADALKLGIIAGIVGLVLVMLFMWFSYGHFGLLANFALIIYVILMLFFLQAIPFVQLTLPGIAGIILGLGMAVDANIIIFERIKDEYAMGKKIVMSTKAGFKKAFMPILDANITTIIAAIVLWILGTATVKGFAITLLLGIILSMFTSLVMTRLLVKWYLPLNSTNAKKLRLKREANINEIG